MDPALPPGGLERIFQQYDAIRSHGSSARQQADSSALAAPDVPPWEPEEDAEPVANTRPQEQSVAGGDAPRAPTQVAGFLTKTDDSRITVERPATQQVLSDATRARPRGRPKSWAEDAETKRREGAGRQRMEFDIEHPNRGTFQKDEEGLNLAYHDVNKPTEYDPDNTGTYYDPSTRTLYVRGSVTKQDWKDDVTKIPAWGNSRDIEMYQNAKKAYEKLISQGKPVDRISGHSLGGSVALQLQKDKDIPFSRTFGAPVWQLNPFDSHAERYRHPADPFSIFDRGATNILPSSINTHSYGGFSNNSSLFGKSLGV